MPFDPHERARFLMDESRIAGISSEDTEWLSAHLGECAACAQQETTTARMLGTMHELAFAANKVERVVGFRGALPYGRASGSGAQVIRGGLYGGGAFTRHRGPRYRMRWPLAAAAAILLVGIPLYKAARDARQAEADALLLERVEAGVSRVVPAAMEPLLQPQLGDSQ